MPLRKRMAAVAVSAVMAFSLCPWAQALADTGSAQNDEKKAVQIDTKSADQGSSSVSASKSDASDSESASVSKPRSQSSSRSIGDNESSADDNKLNSGLFGFELYVGKSKAASVWADDDSGKFESTSFGEIDYGSSLSLKVRGSNGYLDADDFSVSGLGSTNSVGTHTITVTGKGAYTGSMKLTYTVGGDLSNTKTTAVSTHFANGGYYARTGSAIKPKLSVKVGSTTLTEGKDYELVYANNVEGDKNGNATVYAKGKGAFEGSSTAKKTFHIVGLTYNSYGQGKWKGSTKLGQTSGTSTGTKKVGKIAVKKTSKVLSGDVSYSVFNDNKWRGAKNGGNAGIAGQAAQTMWFKLSGNMGKRFDIYYRVCISGAGWMAWAKNGSYAGVKNFNSKMKITGYQVKLVEKNGSKPANADLSTVYASKWDSFAKDILYSRIKNKDSRSNYTISVDTTFNRVAIYKGSKGKWKLQKYWKCGTGIKSRPTTKGDFTLSSKKRARIDSGNISYWNFRGYGGSLGFHSVVTKPGSKTKLAKPLSQQLGVNVSHGCVRVSMENSRYVWNLPNGTSVRIRGLV